MSKAESRQPAVAGGPSTRLGLLTPSSNSALEPICATLLTGLTDVSVHFARFPVTEISLADAAQEQFAETALRGAARLLADARVAALCWAGTSAGWLGPDRDRALCDAITRDTGIPATSSFLTLLEVMQRAGITRVGLVTPYLDVVQTRIIATLAADGINAVAERHLGLSDNFAFATVEADVLTRLITDVATSGAEAVVVLCTNLRVAPLVPSLERQLGIPVLDSAAAALWGALQLAGVPPRRLARWGRLFAGTL